MADKVRFYIVDTPFGYIVSTKRIVLKLKDNNEESQYKLFDKMDDINSEIIHKHIGADTSDFSRGRSAIHPPF